MSDTQPRPTPARCPALLAMVLSLVLAGCTSGPPAPAPNTPVAPTYRTVLEEFSTRMLGLGAPAVLIETRINGEPWSHASGVRSLDGGAPAEVTDPVHVASVTKSMVAVSVLKLVEEGAIKLGDPVEKHLPGFDAQMKPPGPVTVEQLLRHETGLPAYDEALFKSRPVLEALTQPMTAEQNLALAASIPWVLVPGSGMQYSNSNYVVLGLILERVRGRPVAEVLRTDIIEPLGLAGTHLAGPGTAPATMVHGYITINGDRKDVTYPGGLIGNPAAGLVSTVRDMNTFYAALMDGKLLASATVEEMRLAPRGYGLGLDLLADSCSGGFYYGHGGDWAGYGTLALTSVDTKRQLAIVLAYPPEPTNTTPNVPSNPLAWEMVRIVRKAMEVSC